jgi:histone-lysine N-methyltransferase SETD3
MENEYQALERWCTEHGSSINGVVAADVGTGGRGVVAAQPLPPSHVVLEVPERLLMSVASARRDQRLGPLVALNQLSSNQALAVHLLHEGSKNAASFWAVYIQHLPRSYATLVTFSEQEMDDLQLPEAREAASSAVAEARVDWQRARPALRALDLPAKWRTFPAWQWAAATISSRTMFVPFDPVGCLTPFGDLHNYEPPGPPCTPDMLSDAPGPTGAAAGAEPDASVSPSSASGDGSYDEATRSYKIVTRRAYETGQQVRGDAGACSTWPAGHSASSSAEHASALRRLPAPPTRAPRTSQGAELS